jgi:6-pyruvoyl-tetrahydropterin synthase
MQLFVDHLTVIDCSYLHPQHGVLGESWIVDVALVGSLDEQSMVMDFGMVKKRIKAMIDELVDHKLLVPQKSLDLVQLTGDAAATTLVWEDAKARTWTHTSPAEALCVLDAQVITTQVVRDYLIEKLSAEMPESVDAVQLTLYHEPLEEGMYYHYSHGLKKHDGNCQRIAHGHRSKLEIWRDGEFCVQTIRDVCAKWAQAYLVSQSDIVEQTDSHIISEYDAPQGHFRLEAPRDACDIVPHDSTVERIAEHVAQQLKKRDPQANWCVKAYEGVRKGAIVTL